LYNCAFVGFTAVLMYRNAGNGQCNRVTLKLACGNQRQEGFRLSEERMSLVRGLEL